MKRKTPKRTRTNPGKIVHRANRIFHGADFAVSLVNLKTEYEWKDDAIVNLYRHIRSQIGAVRDDGLRRECDGMVKL